MYQALYRKWRPLTFDEVVGQIHITRTLKTQVSEGRLSHAYIFTGTRGTGKTTCAKILARAVNCEHPVDGNPCNRCPSCRGILDGSVLDVLELDAASNNGVDQVRALRDEAIYSPASVKKRVYIVDEVHMLSTAAFNALLKILEEPPEHLMFILATTELHKVPPTILSRCQRFSFKRIPPDDIVNRLDYVARQEKIELSKDAATLLARLADGGMRDALSLLDQCTAGGTAVDRDCVLSTLGLAGNIKTAHILNAVRRGNARDALREFGELYTAGKDVSAVLSELISLCRDLLIRQIAPDSGLMTGGYDEATLKTLTRKMPPERLIEMTQLLEQATEDCRRSGNSRTVAEVCLIRMCDPSLDGSASGLAARIARLEERVTQGIPAHALQKEEDEAFQPDELPSRTKTPPAVETEHASQKEKEADKSSQSPISSQTVEWDRILQAVHGAVSPSIYPFLKRVTAHWQGDKLMLQMSDPMIYEQLNTPGVLRTIADAAYVQIGRAVQVELRKQGPQGSMEDLRQCMEKYGE